MASTCGIILSDHALVKVSYLNTSTVTSALQDCNRHIVLTSKHALLALQSLPLIDQFTTDKLVYCIKGKTSDLAEELGFKIAGSARDSMKLAEQILQDKVTVLTHITNNIRLNDWVDVLEKNDLVCNAIEVYHKEKCRYHWENYSGVAFFSPSQIDAFMMHNVLYKNMPAFCIGDTTASYAKSRGFEKTVVSETPSEEHMIQRIVAYYKAIK